MKRNNNIQESILSTLTYRRPSPFFLLARMILVPIGRLLGLPNKLQPVIFGLWSVTSTFVAACGIFPTLAGIWALKGAIRHPIEYINQQAPEVGRELINQVAPLWREILRSRDGLVRYFSTVAFTVIFYALRPISLMLIRRSISLICSALGIFWSETLRGFDFLFNLANSIKSFFKFVIGFDLPKPKELIDTPAKKNYYYIFRNSSFNFKSNRYWPIFPQFNWKHSIYRLNCSFLLQHVQTNYWYT
uniref:hypothetical protein n=1 Tax=Inonotus hispidus TaxID=40469 RepID=UPI0021824E38|nr:hypothetical protein N4M07_mgp057 [Inonotus hispidus]UVF37995.1 hypothetical protein [Inonotus hispidus]